MFFFPVLSHSSLQLRIRFFHSPYQVILSYFVFFVPSIFLLLLLSYFSFAPPQFLSLSLDAGIVYIFFLLSPSYYIKGLSSLSLSSNSRCLECSNAPRCITVADTPFLPPPLAHTRFDAGSRSLSRFRWTSISFRLPPLHPLSFFAGETNALYSRRVFVPPPGKFLLVSIFGKLPYPRALQFSPCFFLRVSFSVR